MQQIDKEIEAILLYPQEAQKLLGIGSTKFYELVRLDNFPKPRKVGTVKTPMFLRSELNLWAKSLEIDLEYFNKKEV